MVQVCVKAVNSFAGAVEMPEPDVRVITSDGICISAHSKFLAAASPVLENLLERSQKAHRSNEARISVLGVPCDAVSVFVQFLYSSKCSEDQMEKYGIHLLALSHVYSVPLLKQLCTIGLGKCVTIGNVVDILQLARLCDTPDLYIKCMKLMYHNFEMIQKSEGWKFLQKYDPHLELEILKFIEETEMRKKRARKRRVDQSLYAELSEAMECLQHICSEGCTHVGPYDMDTSKHKGPCTKFSICHGLQLLIKHFGSCKRKVKGGCSRCRRMWQLFKLHSSVCDQLDDCRVPLCRQFKFKVVHDGASDDQWRLLVRKVVSAKAVAVLSLILWKEKPESFKKQHIRKPGLI